MIFSGHPEILSPLGPLSLYPEFIVHVIVRVTHAGKLRKAKGCSEKNHGLVEISLSLLFNFLFT
jgi:hypothetical protein